MTTIIETGRGKLKKGESTRREIIQKAAPLFNQRGFEGASLSALMRATGLEKGGIYRHFQSKEQLATEAFDFAWKTALTLRLAGAEQIGNSVERLKQIIRNFRGKREGLVQGGCPLLNTAIDSDDGNEALRRRARHAMKSWSEHLVEIIEDGKRRGEIRSEVKAKDLANLVVGTLEGSLMIGRLQKTDEPLRLACRHLEEYLDEKARA